MAIYEILQVMYCLRKYENKKWISQKELWQYFKNRIVYQSYLDGLERMHINSRIEKNKTKLKINLKLPETTYNLINNVGSAFKLPKPIELQNKRCKFIGSKDSSGQVCRKFYDGTRDRFPVSELEKGNYWYDAYHKKFASSIDGFRTPLVDAKTRKILKYY